MISDKSLVALRERERERERESSNLKNKKGITLIALVITIIVLLILAGVTIATLTGDNGLLTKAGQAKNASSDAEIEEQIKLAIVESQTSKHLNTGKSELENIEESLSKTFKDTVTVEKMGKGYKIRIGNTKTTYRMKTDGTVYKYEEMDPTSIYGKLDENAETLYLRTTSGSQYEEFTKWSSKYRIEKKWNQEKIKKIIIEEPIAPDTATEMFYGCNNLEEIEMIENLHIENVSSLRAMFQECKSLLTIDISKFDSSNVTDMSNMFCGCKLLNNINLDNIDTSNVNSMNSMFKGCSKLTELNLDSFDTSSVTDMTSMFHDCVKIASLDLHFFNTENVTVMKNMFNCCWKLKNLNIEYFNMNNVTNMSNMFYSVPNTIVIKATPATKTRIIGEYPDLENNFE